MLSSESRQLHRGKINRRDVQTFGASDPQTLEPLMIINKDGQFRLSWEMKLSRMLLRITLVIFTFSIWTQHFLLHLTLPPLAPYLIFLSFDVKSAWKTDLFFCVNPIDRHLWFGPDALSLERNRGNRLTLELRGLSSVVFETCQSFDIGNSECMQNPVRLVLKLDAPERKRSGVSWTRDKAWSKILLHLNFTASKQ